MRSWLVAVFTDTEPVFLFCPRKIVVLAEPMFISIVLFQFGCFALSVEAFKWFISKVCTFCSKNILCGLYEHPSVVCPKHAFMPCWIAVQYVARVLYFSASSFFLGASVSL